MSGLRDECERCGRDNRELNRSQAADGRVVCLRCHLRSADLVNAEVISHARTMYRGPERAACIGRIVAEDVKAGVPLIRTLYDVRQANAVSFDPPFSDERLEAIVHHRLVREGVLDG